MYKINRILDANVNRAAEGIRVIEDVCRFYFEDEDKTKKLREIRHKLRKTFKNIDDDFVNSRDSEHDIGKDISQNTTLDKKTDLKQLITANFKRVEEAVRTMEESLKIIEKYEKSKIMENIRYEAYYLEKEILKLITIKLPKGIYGITAEKYSNGRKNIDVVREMIESGVKIIQYREKYKSMKEKYEECLEIREITRKNSVIFIVNDHIDIAMMVDADGVHIGQDDVPIKEVRKLVGNKIIGLSTHSKEQYQKALEDGADYIGVGPIYKTYTKDDVCDPVGLEYLEYAVKENKIPFVAIGGIKENNIYDVINIGAETICLVTEIVGAENINDKIVSLLNKMNK
ncbi:MAG: thiamine phosphate synthase [Fusobacteria bacterium]|nr:thiamine phosphate synthase [Fusobacteriota bacterium]